MYLKNAEISKLAEKYFSTNLSGKILINVLHPRVSVVEISPVNETLLNAFYGLSKGDQ